MCHTPLAGTCLWQASLAEWRLGGRGPPEGQESPLMLSGLVTGPGSGLRGWGRRTSGLGPLSLPGLWLWREVWQCLHCPCLSSGPLGVNPARRGWECFVRLSATCQESSGHCHDKPGSSALAGLTHTLCLYLQSSPGPGQDRFQTPVFLFVRISTCDGWDVLPSPCLIMPPSGFCPLGFVLPLVTSQVTEVPP